VATVGHYLAAERDDEGLAAESVNIGRDRLEPVYEPVLRPQSRPGRSALRRLSACRAIAVSFSLANDCRLPLAPAMRTPTRSRAVT